AAPGWTFTSTIRARSGAEITARPAGEAMTCAGASSREDPSAARAATHRTVALDAAEAVAGGAGAGGSFLPAARNSEPARMQANDGVLMTDLPRGTLRARATLGSAPMHARPARR